MEIPYININNTYIPPTTVWDITSTPPVVNYIPVPVVVNIGKPIVDMPGCVEDHPYGGPQLAQDDPKGTKILCTNEYPSYNAMDYTPEDLIITKQEEVPPVASPEVPAAPEIPADAIPQTKEEEPPCPPPNALRIGDVAQNQKERVSGYEIQNGICVTLYEDIPFVAQYLPTAQVATTTAAIAVTAASSALLAKPLADLLLKVFKPLIKKVIGKVQKLTGKKVKIESLKERRDLQRERSRAIRTLRQMTKGK